MFRLSEHEKREVVTICDHLVAIKYSRQLPYVFTEQGVAMLSSVLKSGKAVLVNVQIMRAFVSLRREALTYVSLKRKMDALEKKYDARFSAVFDALRQLLSPPATPKRPIGFVRYED